MEKISKNYKPEILLCPICGSKLSYRHTVSDKLVYFSNGKRLRIKNLGYGCPRCNNHIYSSQTANKFSFKGYTYSAKIVCMIASFKERHYTRDMICDYFFSKNIEISDRNIDNLYRKYLELYHLDDKKTIPMAFDTMLSTYKQIRLAVDLITVENEKYLILYDYFTGDVLTLKMFLSFIDMEDFLKQYINPSLNISVILTIRKDSVFVPMLKKLCPSQTKFMAFNKF